MEKFESILLKNNWPKREQPISEVNQKVEQELEFKLPLDYINFLENYFGNESFIRNQFITLFGFEELLEANKDYEVFDTLLKTIAIGGNGAGELIAIEILNSQKIRIVLTPAIGLSIENHIKIGDSFTDFLSKLESGINWFD